MNRRCRLLLSIGASLGTRAHCVHTVSPWKAWSGGITVSDACVAPMVPIVVVFFYHFVRWPDDKVNKVWFRVKCFFLSSRHEFWLLELFPGSRETCHCNLANVRLLPLADGGGLKSFFFFFIPKKNWKKNEQRGWRSGVFWCCDLRPRHSSYFFVTLILDRFSNFKVCCF